MEVERSSVGRVLPFVIDEAVLCEIERSEWKGNYRELRNFAARLAVESMDLSAITLEMVRKALRSDSSPGGAGAALPLPETDSDREADLEGVAERKFVTVLLDPESDDLDSIYVKAAATFIEHALNKSNGSLRLAARSMNTTHSTLSRILRKHKERSANAPTNSQYRALTYSAAA
jgi:DNA-binding NtrC family response regulator